MTGWRSRISMAMALGLAFALGLSGTSAAYQVVSDQGTRGNYGEHDELSHPGGRCGYAPADVNGIGNFRWMKIFAPGVLARDTSPGREHQTVTWEFNLQRQINGGSWHNVASSERQTKTAYDDLPAAFTPLKVSFNARYNGLFRAIMIIRWLRNGSVDGVLKLRIEYYGIRWNLGDNSHVFTDSCWGAVA